MQSTPAVRRSKRLASEEPSPPAETAHAPTRVQAKRAVTAFDPYSTITTIMRGNRAVIPKLTSGNLQALVHVFANRAQESDERIETLEHNLQRAQSQHGPMTMRRGRYNMKMSEIMQKHGHKQKTEAPTQTAQAPPPAPAETATSPRPVTPPEAITTTPGAAPPSSIWRSFTNYLNPFSRKRAAEDEPDSSAPPSQKRQKPTEPAPSPNEQPTTTHTPAVTQPTTTPTPATTEQPSMAPSPAPAQRPTAIPTPKRKRTTAPSTTATPLPKIVETSPQTPLTGMMGITPRPRRTLANTRKAPQTTQPDRRWAWESTPKVKMPNADERFAKIKRAEQLRRELATIEQEEDLARKIKRVKVDHLTEIPHNRPGDSSSTFRVPDIDSDDEMEVYDDVEERANIFSTPQPPAQQAATQLPHPPELKAQHLTTPLPQIQQGPSPLSQPPQLPAQQLTTPLSAPTQPVQQQVPTSAPPRFTFPCVGTKPADYHVTAAYQAACGALFAAGLAAST